MRKTILLAARLATAFYFLFTSALGKAESSGTEEFVVLPLLNYSSNAGVGYGIEAALLQLMGTGFDLKASLFLEPGYGETNLRFQALNRKWMDLFYFSFSTGLDQIQNAEFYGLGNATTQQT